jgi:hypothetical protein
VRETQFTEILQQTTRREGIDVYNARNVTRSPGVWRVFRWKRTHRVGIITRPSIANLTTNSGLSRMSRDGLPTMSFQFDNSRVVD